MSFHFITFNVALNCEQCLPFLFFFLAPIPPCFFLYLHNCNLFGGAEDVKLRSRLLRRLEATDLILFNLTKQLSCLANASACGINEENKLQLKQFILLPFWHSGPWNPGAHKQRYPFSVNPVWQVAWFLQGLLTQALWKKKQNEENANVVSVQ